MVPTLVLGQRSTLDQQPRSQVNTTTQFMKNMSKKQLNEFFVALGLGDRKHASAILEAVVSKKLAKIVNETTPEFPVSGNGYLGSQDQGDDLEGDDQLDTMEQHNPEADKWNLIAQYVAAKQAIGLGVVGTDHNLEQELEDIREQLAGFGEDEVAIADTIVSMLEDGEYEDVEQTIEVPEDFKEQLDAAMEQYSDTNDQQLDDVDVGDIDDVEQEVQDEELVDDLDMEEYYSVGRGRAGMAGLGERMLMRGKKVVENDELDDLDDLDSTVGDGLDDSMENHGDDFDELESDIDSDFDDEMEQSGDQVELRNYIQDCVLNSNMDIDECYNAVRTQFGDHFTDEQIDQIYNDVIDNMPELNT